MCSSDLRGAQTHQALLAGHMRLDNPRFQAHLQALQAYLSQHADAVTAKLKALGLSYDLLLQQATLLAYMDSFRVLAYLCLCCIPGVLLLRRANKGGPRAMAH